MSDYLLRAIGGGGNVRAFVATATALADEARRRHDSWPTVTAALGRALTAAALLGATLKDQDESLTFRIDGDGPAGGIICDADERGNVRGYVRNPHVDLPPRDGKFDVSGVVGNGFIHVIRQLALQGTYTGTAELVTGEIGDDLAHYLTTSEQTPSAVALGVRVAPDGTVVAAGGFLIQALPAATDEERQQLESNIAALGAVSRAVDEGLSPEAILGQVLAGLDYKVLERRELGFQCRCSRERALAVMAAMDADEFAAMSSEDKGAEMTCQFCGEVYRFDEAELLAARADSR